jgi:recombination protein RecR
VNQRVDPFSRLVFELSKLPGVGEKTATRFAYYILNQDAEYSSALARSIEEAKSKIHFCGLCFNLTEEALCQFCSDPRRDTKVICVVERPSDISSLERSGHFKGRYHVLHGVLSPMDGIGPDAIRAKPLLERLRPSEVGSVDEVIFALNPTVEAEATLLYLSRLIRPSGIRVTQVAYGLPMGGAIEFSDRHTLARALDHRVEVSSR